jgi:hypothetical protein
MCRRANGSSFATNASVRTEEFRVIAGRELIREYQSSPGNFRAFCSNCGSPVYGTVGEVPSIRRIRVGTLDEVNGAKSLAHIWTGSKSEWFEFTDELQRFEAAPPAKYWAVA